MGDDGHRSSSGGSTKKEGGSGKRLLHLDVASSCILLLGIVSSSYLAFLAGRAASSSLPRRLVAPPSSPQSCDVEVGDGGAAEKKEAVPEAPPRLPSGQHLYVDFRHYSDSSSDLLSPGQLADAMTSLIDDISEFDSTLLSYHCHPLRTTGATCAAVLVDGHLTIHEETIDNDRGGTMLALDLNTRDEDVDLISTALPLIERLFAGANDDDDDTPASKMTWGYQLRGFRDGFDDYRRAEKSADEELGEDILPRRDFILKRPLASERTMFQSADVYELRHRRGAPYSALGLSAIEGDGLPEDVVTDRALFIDGVLQSSTYGEAAYHEALVHPALLAHPNPRRVAIIGGGEGATLREVLKHDTVEEAVMIEIDRRLTEVSREYLPGWSDCSDIGGTTEEEEEEGTGGSCFEDPRATVYYQDAFAYFLEEFGVDDEEEEEDGVATDNEDDDGDEEVFDVIIMDALDPDDFGPFVDKLYNDTEFIRTLHDGLAPNGVMVVQVGSIPYWDDPPDEMSDFYNRAHMIDRLEEVGFTSVHSYDEGHCHFYSPWQFLVAFKEDVAKANFERRSSAEIEVALHGRLRKTKSGVPPLRYFDGSVMEGYRIAPKVVETNYCRREWEGKKDYSMWACQENVRVGRNPNLVKGGSGLRSIDQRIDMMELMAAAVKE